MPSAPLPSVWLTSKTSTKVEKLKAPMDPDMVGDGDVEITRQQNRNYCIAEGFRRMQRNQMQSA